MSIHDQTAGLQQADEPAARPQFAAAASGAEMERALRSLQAAQDIADAIGSVAELDHVLELIVRRGRSLVEARSVLVLVREGDDLVVAASAGEITGVLGRRLPIGSTSTGQILLRGQPLRVSGFTTQTGHVAAEMGVASADAALVVPMLHRSAGIGVLAAFDRGSGGGPFQIGDEQLLRTFAASAANAVAIKRSVDADRLHTSIAAAEEERRRWARELHDQTLQGLAAIRMELSAAARSDDPGAYRQAMRDAVADLETEANNLRAIISDLRPPLLDDLGLAPALEALMDTLMDSHGETGFQIERRIELPAEGRDAPAIGSELATTAYRLVQEALTNVVKHAQASSCRVVVKVLGSDLFVEVSDDGHGYDASLRTSGFGLPGMRERAYLAGGKLELASGNRGTVVRAYLPLETSNVVRPTLRARAGA